MGAIPPIHGARFQPNDESLQLHASELSAHMDALISSLNSLSLERVNSPEFLQEISEQIKSLSIATKKIDELP